MQGLADGYFIAPSTVTAWLAGNPTPEVTPEHPACRNALESTLLRIETLLANGGSTPVDSFHRELGAVMIERCGISRDADGLRDGLNRVAELEARFHAEVRVPGDAHGPNAELEKALRGVISGQVQRCCAMPWRGKNLALTREEHQSAEGEARRDDANFAHIAAWEHQDGADPIRHSEPLQFTALQPSTRSYK